MKGHEVNILTGVHGDAMGTMIPDASMFADDVARFGQIPGVTVHNVPDMSPNQIREVLNKPGTTIGAFCNSGQCLGPYRQ
jgi:hypothetical protein